MSEEIVRAQRETEQNLNNKKVPVLRSASSIDYDEIGEEFDFSDSDLEQQEFNDNDNKVAKHTMNVDNDDDRLTVATVSTTTTTETTIVGRESPSTHLPHDVPVENTTQSPKIDDVIANSDHVESHKNNNNNNKVNQKHANELNGEKHSTTAIDTEDDDDDYYSDEPEDELIVQFLGEANRIAEARLTARRQARTEARTIRMRELERQQKDQENDADRVYDMHSTNSQEPITRTRASSRLEETILDEETTGRGNNLRETRQELKDAEERFRKAMIANAQLDNERAAQSYQIQHLKDQLEELEESHAQLQREVKEKTRDGNALKRNLDKLTEELKLAQGQLHERDALIADQGLVIVAVENADGTDARRTLISAENAQLLGSVQGSLDVRLKRFNDEKQQLKEEILQLHLQLDNYKSKDKEGYNTKTAEQLEEETEAQREANKIISDYKFRLQKTEQEVASLQASLARSESQLVRYKTAAEEAEKAEAELKGDRRKLQRENREAIERLEELETSNSHLQKRLDKLKNAKSALLKDL